MVFAFKPGIFSIKKKKLFLILVVFTYLDYFFGKLILLIFPTKNLSYILSMEIFFLANNYG